MPKKAREVLLADLTQVFKDVGQAKVARKLKDAKVQIQLEMHWLEGASQEDRKEYHPYYVSGYTEELDFVSGEVLVLPMEIMRAMVKGLLEYSSDNPTFAAELNAFDLEDGNIIVRCKDLVNGHENLAIEVDQSEPELVKRTLKQLGLLTD